MLRHILLFILTQSIALGIATAAIAEEAAPAEKVEKLDPQELVVGDWYEVTVTRQQVQKEHDGYLVMANDDWLVLGVILAEGRVSGTPWLAELPYIGALFRSSGQVITRNYQWIPRSAVTMTGHMRYPNQAGFEDFRGDTPKLEKQGWVTVAEQGKASSESYELVGVEGHQLRVATQKYELQKGAESRWSGLPLVGGLFNNDHYVARRGEQAVPMEDVMCVRQCSLYDLKNHRAIPAEETPDWFRN